MFIYLALAAVLLAICVAIHAIVLTAVYRWAVRSPLLQTSRFWPLTWLLIQVAWWTLLAHLVEIVVWAGFYTWQEVFADLDTAFYFSLVTYTTVGYGDVVASEHWRHFAALEGLVGILMCGWSTGFLFAIVNQMYLSIKAKTSSRS